MPEQTSAAYPVASTDPIDLRFTKRTSVTLEVRFYADLAGTVPIPQSDGGSRDIDVQLIRRVHYDDPGLDTVLYSPIAGSPFAFLGGTAQLIGLGTGRGEVRLVATGTENPVGALSYRMVLS